MAFQTPAYLALSRHGIFYFRITIPASLRALLGTREVKRSLKTPSGQNIHEASRW